MSNIYYGFGRIFMGKEYDFCMSHYRARYKSEEISPRALYGNINLLNTLISRKLIQTHWSKREIVRNSPVLKGIEAMSPEVLSF